MAEASPYIVSARKYRPATFATVVGQQALTSTLKNAIDSKRLAQAYLFTGPRGVGKTSCARIFAKTINCLSPTPEGEACGHCESCRAIEQGNSFNIIELDAASNNSVDDIRQISDQVNVPPQSGSYRVFIIDEVHMLSPSAFNAFLKTLEEPPSYVIFILATTEKHKVIPTILSRCQIYDFKRITVDDIAAHLAYVASRENIEAAPDALNVIARKADGAMRDALSIFDQVSASTMGHISYEATIANLNVLDYDYYFRLIDAFRTSDVAEALLIYKEIRDKGFDSLFFINGLASHVRDLMVAADPRTLPLLEAAHDVADRYCAQARSLPLQWYFAALKILNDCDVNYRTSSDRRLLVELSLIRLCQLLSPSTPPFDAIDSTPPLRSTQPRPSSGIPDAHTHADTISRTDPSPSPSAPALKTAPPAPIPDKRPAAPATGTKQTPPHKKPSTFRLSEQADDSAPASLETRTNPFSPEAFHTAWQQFIIANPSLHILTNAMRTAIHEQSSPVSYRIIVSHPAQQQAFESAMNPLLSFLRNALSNDLLTISVEVSAAPESEKRLPPQEFLKKIITDNPTLGNFFKDIDGEIS